MVGIDWTLIAVATISLVLIALFVWISVIKIGHDIKTYESREERERDVEIALMSPTERADRGIELTEDQAVIVEGITTDTWGSMNVFMICPHCQTRGTIRTKRVEKKSGISGSKAAGAVLTGGLSVALTGLSAVDTLTQAHCETCSNTWVF